MPSRTKKISKTVTLIVSRNRDPISYQCCGEKLENLNGRPELSRAKKSAKGMYILMALTALRQKEPQADLPNYFRDKDHLQEILKSVDETIRKAQYEPWHATGWLPIFFKKSPLGVILTMETKNPDFIIDFLDDVHIDIRDDTSKEELPPDDIRRFIDNILGITEEDVYIKFDVINSNGHSRIISNTTYKGRLFAGETIRILITSNYPVHFLVFLVDPRGFIKCHPRIYDHPKFYDYETYLDPLPSGERKLLIPSNNSLKVRDCRGMASCVVLINPREIQDPQIKEIMIRMGILLSSYSFHASISEWGYFDSPLEQEERPRMEPKGKMNFERCTSPSEWEAAVIDQMHGFAERINFLHIPLNPENLQ